MNWTPTVQQQELFQKLYELILSGNSQQNLTRITDPQEFWEKHLWDSLRGIAFLLSGQTQENTGDKEDSTPSSSPIQNPHCPLSPEGAPSSPIQNPHCPLSPEGAPSSPIQNPQSKIQNPKSKIQNSQSPTFIDIGTGAGFPGIPVAMTVAHSTVTLLDSTRKKIAFLDRVKDELHLSNIKTVTGRAEEISHQIQHRQQYDVALIRAVGTASVCAEYTLPLLKQDGLAVIYRGNWTEDEAKSLENAVQQLGGTIESVEEFKTPLTQSIRHCLYLRKIATTPSQFPRAIGVPTQKPL
ncbi:16S rRNA (guanine(527)-N(7))-methyltransferase RsmG [Scytonema sp. UIC 10036]|uniref:16S rRNA (guanine(527)-N(7))-methyltransferase RsmG n=1 Tax=Scytonema sp. UIC 10036 TaxID=2304196 RepID=UPI0012DAA123|nr:16S rRNA (guanine(527)-N(7))-methyltransferase RsmG [Scytonema sp. UIC 10036]MUG97364.1 16S rRNA (guanine(527)-N(7))-methyltransferase RsmG [Scytonema sp. UIC 10036]